MITDPQKALFEIRLEKQRRACVRSFSEFVKVFWHLVPQCDPLVWGWHMDVMCRHFEEVAHGRMPRLLINCPPGHAKSVLLAVLWPAWIWTWWPKCQLFFTSYSMSFVLRDSTRCRAVIESELYKELFSNPQKWKLSDDQNTKSKFTNTAGGSRQCSSVGGEGTGIRAHIIGIDDPINQLDALSKTVRETTNDFIGQTLTTRFVDARQPRIAMIMQRLHEEDPSHFVMSGKDWEHLMLPSEYDSFRQSVTYVTVDGERKEFWRDPRTQDGELLFSAKFPREVLENFKLPNSLGSDGFASQHQQMPMPADGGMFNKANWRFWKSEGTPDCSRTRPRGCWDGPAREVPTSFDRIIISVDATFKKTVSGSFVSMQVWGKKGPDRYLLDRVHDRMDFEETCQALKMLAKKWPKAYGKYIEAKANGEAIMSRLKKEISGMVPVEASDSKEARAYATQPFQKAGNVFLPDGAPWLDEYINEHAMFPKGAHDDDVDAQSQGILALEEADTTAQKWMRARL